MEKIKENIWRGLASRRLKLIKPFGLDSCNDLLQLTLCDTNPDVVAAWARAFADVAPVEIVAGSLLDARGDALVSPANSFGDMGGGVDKAIDDFFGGEAQRRLMAAIREQFLGELPVGMALIVELPPRRFRFLIAAPTMRVPNRLGETLNAYLAMRAVLVAIFKHNGSGANPISRVVVPGLATGVGGLAPDEAAGQMRAAWDNVVGGGWERVVSPALAPYAWRPKRK